MHYFPIVINTSDSYSDCWLPVFELLQKYWPEISKHQIYLNTESKAYTHTGLNIISTKVNKGVKRRLTWSECLLRQLDIIEEDIFLYLQEDYFFSKKVQVEELQEAYDFISNNNIDCLQLTDQATNGPFDKSEYENYWEVIQGAAYRVSCQAALWNKKSLKKLVKKRETAWEFERYGTERSNYLNLRVYNINKEKFENSRNPILSYIFTGIVKGRWHKDVPELFAKNNIEIDYSVRGMFVWPGEKSKKHYCRLSFYKNYLLNKLDVFRLKHRQD